MATFLKGAARIATGIRRGRLQATRQILRVSVNQYSSSKRIIYNQKFRLFQTSAVRAKIIPFYLSDIGEGIREVNVKEWFVNVGDIVKQFDNICEVQSDKASVTITSRFDGKITKLHHKIDSIAYVGQPLVDIDVEDEPNSKDAGDEIQQPVDVAVTEEANQHDDDPTSNKSKVLATPAVRRIAMQNKLDLSEVPATGKGGRVLKEDILKHLNISSDDSNTVQKVPIKPPTVTSAKVFQPKIQHSESQVVGDDKIVPLNVYNKAMVKTMTIALSIPHFSYCDEIDVSQLVVIRESTKEAAQQSGVKLTLMPFFIKAASLALSKYPVLNSSLDEKNESIIYKAAHNIGVAMDTVNGLIVPNIKNVQTKNVLQIANELNRLQQDGLNGTFKLDDLSGGTFSISNIGTVGGTYTKPVILSPQVAIGALGKIQVLPRFSDNGDVVKAQIICVSWSADHRIIDGVTMAKFSNKWKYYVENPSHLMLGL